MIKIGLEKKSFWEVNQVVNADDIFPGKTRMIQALKELTPIIEGSISDKEMKKLKYSKNLAVFFPRFLEIFEGIRTPVRGYEIKYKDNHYQVNANCFYDYKSSTLYAMPLSFLPELKKKNKVLHDMIVEAVKILSNKQVPVIDDPFGYDDDWMLENMIEYCSVQKDDVPDDDQSLGSRELKLFLKHKKKYVEKILTGHGDRLWLIGQIAKYKPTLKVEDMVITWLNEVLDAANEPHDLEDFNENAKCEFARMNEIEYEDIYDDGQPVEILQVMKFVWFGCAGYMDTQTENLGEMGGNFGEIEFCHMYECTKPGELEESRKKFIKDWGLFPEKLTVVLAHGNILADELWDYIDNKLTTILDNNGKR
jgi:hypothetical protein